MNVNGYILLAAVYSLLLLGSLYLPPWVTLPAGFAVTLLLMLRVRVEHRKKISKIQNRLQNLRSEGLFLDSSVKGTEDDVFYRMILTLLTDLERSLFKLVEKNIQLLSLKEIGRNIISSLDEQKLIDSVFDYLVKGVGYKEVAFVLLRKKRQCFQAIVSIERSTRVIRRVVNFGFDDLEGAVYNSFLSGKPFLIRDVNMHPLFNANEEEIFPGSTMTSYLCVPLMKSTEEILCHKSELCAMKKMARGKGAISGHKPYMRYRECLSCPETPLLGAIIITDGFRAAPLTNIDQVTIETVGSLVSSNIENWLLYQELRQEEIFRDKVLEGMIHGLFVIDLSRNVSFANRSARLMSQYDPEGISGMSINSLVYIESSPEGAPFFQVLNDRTTLLHHEAYLKRKDGIHIPIRMNISPLIGEDKVIQGAIILFVDLSEMKRMEEEIRHLDRLAVLGRFTSAIAHEVRNPLTGIAAGIQYLNRDEHLSDDQRENISFILGEVDRLNRIITDLFKIAKPRKLLYQKVDLRDLLRSSYQALVELIADKKIDFLEEIDDNLEPIEVDNDQIIQVLINLVKNALEAVDAEGKVKIRASRYMGEDQEVVREKAREMICIEIADDGPGIDPEEKDRIFEPFFSKKKGGTGLGLFVSHSIVQHHQGRIIVSSEPGIGTTFKLYLPIRAPGKEADIEAGSASG